MPQHSSSRKGCLAKNLTSLGKSVSFGGTYFQFFQAVSIISSGSSFIKRWFPMPERHFSITFL
jgi:hypothetical protein